MVGKIFKSRKTSYTQGTPYYVKVLADKVEWVDNPNAPKSTTAPMYQVLVQRQKVLGNGVNCVDDKSLNPFTVWADRFDEFFEAVNA